MIWMRGHLRERAVYLCSLKLLMAISGDTLHLHNKNINLVQKGRLLTLLPATCRDPDKAGKFNLSPFPFVAGLLVQQEASVSPSQEEDVLISINNIAGDCDSHILSGMQHCSLLTAV